MSVLVVGGGIAGTAAALAAGRSGVRVKLLDGGTGATTLATGALDLVPWTRDRGVGAPANGARELLDALGAYVVPVGRAWLASASGILRSARAYDAALLDVAPLAGRRVAVVRCARPGWDADALAWSWSEGQNAEGAEGGKRPAATSRPTPSFVAIDARLLRHADERALPDADFAARHDDEERLAWLAQRLREALAAPGAEGVAGVVLPPSLGVDRPRADALSERVGVRCGEALAAPGGPSGLRFERARDRALALHGVERVAARAAAVERSAEDGERWRVLAEDGQRFEADVVVLATGGLIGGGVEYAPTDPARPRPPFRLAIDAPAVMGAFGRPVEIPVALLGLAPEQIAWPYAAGRLLERAGVLTDPQGRCVHPEMAPQAGPRPGPLYAAGDMVADGPRTWLAALEEGTRAGHAAARFTSAAGAPRPDGGPASTSSSRP